MIQSIELNSEGVDAMRREFVHCETLFTEIHNGIENELKQRLRNLESHRDGRNAVNIEAIDLWDALNACYYRYNIAAFADFETSCKRCYHLQQRLLNVNGQGISLLGFNVSDFSSINISFSNPFGVIGYFRIIKLIAIAIECCYSANSNELEREILDKANGYLSIDVENWLGQAVKDIIATFDGSTDLKQLFIQQLKSSRPSLSTPTRGTLYDNILTGLIPHADLAYSLFDGKKVVKGKKLRDIKGVTLRFQSGILPPKFELAKCLKGYVACDKDGRPGIYIGFRGSVHIINFVTDLHQLLFGPDISYFLALGIVAEVYEDLQEYECAIYVVGHSLGGGLAQYATAAIDKANVRAVCYNSAGLSEKTLATLNMRKALPTYKVIHMYVSPDFVFLYGNQLGSAYKYNVKKGPIRAHLMNSVRQAAKNLDYVKLI